MQPNKLDTCPHSLVFWKHALLPWKSSAWRSFMSTGKFQINKQIQLKTLMMERTFGGQGVDLSPIWIELACARQRLAGAVAEGRPAAVRQRAALRVLVSVRQVARVPRGGHGGRGRVLLPRADAHADPGLADASHPRDHPRAYLESFLFFFFFAIPSYLKDLFECISLFSQSDVMQLTDNQTKLKLFMDVLDATKAAVSCKHFGPPRCAARSGPPSLPISWPDPRLWRVSASAPWWPRCSSSFSSSGEGTKGLGEGGVLVVVWEQGSF